MDCHHPSEQELYRHHPVVQSEQKPFVPILLHPFQLRKRVGLRHQCIATVPDRFAVGVRFLPRVSLRQWRVPFHE